MSDTSVIIRVKGLLLHGLPMVLTGAKVIIQQSTHKKNELEKVLRLGDSGVPIPSGAAGGQGDLTKWTEADGRARFLLAPGFYWVGACFRKHYSNVFQI